MYSDSTSAGFPKEGTGAAQGTFPVRWQRSKTWLWWYNARICWATELCPANDRVLQHMDNPLMEPFLVSASCEPMKSYENKHRGRLLRLWLAVQRLNKNSNDGRTQSTFAWKCVACKGSRLRILFTVMVTVCWGHNAAYRNLLHCSRQHSILAMLHNCFTLNLPRHYCYFLLENFLLDITQFFH